MIEEGRLSWLRCAYEKRLSDIKFHEHSTYKVHCAEAVGGWTYLYVGSTCEYMHVQYMYNPFGVVHCGLGVVTVSASGARTAR